MKILRVSWTTGINNSILNQVNYGIENTINEVKALIFCKYSTKATVTRKNQVFGKVSGFTYISKTQ